MPQQQNIVVKNGATTPVDKTFTALVPSAGDGARALWRLQEGPVVGVQPSFQSFAGPNKARNARHLDLIIQVPSYAVAPDGTIRTNGTFHVAMTATIPNSYLEADKANTIAYVQNLIASPAVKDMLMQGISAS